MLGVIAVADLTWLCHRDPEINFFRPDKRAAWILFPSAVDVKARGVANLDTLFRREFTVQKPTSRALLTVRAAKQVGAPVRLAGYLRFALGEGIEKKSEDFAAEVAAQLKK